MEQNLYYIKEYDSPVGKIYIASDETQIKGLWLEGQKYFQNSIKDKKKTMQIQNTHTAEILKQAEFWLDAYFAGKNPSAESLPLFPDGTPFQQEVWSLLRKIPYGEVTTYGALAKEIARRTGKKSMSAQAVGGAVGRNPISIMIPCHRVVGAKGNLTGYAGGIDKKVWLLGLEGIDMSGYVYPAKSNL